METNTQETIPLGQTLFINFMAEINSVTASRLLSIISDHLRTGIIKKIKINISSPGGSVFHAISLYNFISGLKEIEIHTHNFGQVDSAATVIFLSGKKRTCSPVATFLFHGPQRIFMGTPRIGLDKKALTENLTALQSDIDKLVEIISRTTKQEKDKISDFFEKQVVFTAEKAKEENLVHEIIDETIPFGAPYIVTITD